MMLTREVVIVLGVTGSGKTTWAKKYVAHESRLAVYDIAHDFNVQYMSADDIADLPESKPDRFRVGVWIPEDAPLLAASAFLLGNCTLVLEELSTLFPTGAKITGPISEVVYLGRHRRVTLVCIAQRATSIPVAIRSQASRVVTFRQQEDDDVKALVGKIGKENAMRVTGLPDLTCIDWHRGEVTEYSITHETEQQEPVEDESTAGEHGRETDRPVGETDRPVGP